MLDILNVKFSSSSKFLSNIAEVQSPETKSPPQFLKLGREFFYKPPLSCSPTVTYPWVQVG